MDREVFEELLSGFSCGRRRFDVTAEDLDILLPDGWSERAFRTSGATQFSRWVAQKKSKGVFLTNVAKEIWNAVFLCSRNVKHF